MDTQDQLAQQKANCPFCKIVLGEIPSQSIFADSQFKAILDINPVSKGHTLLFPNEHIPIFPMTPPQIQAHIFENLKFLSRGIKQGAIAMENTIFIANGGVAGQQMPHAMIHIIPRQKGDGLFDLSQKSVDETQMQKMRELFSPKKTQQIDLASFIEQNPQIKDLLINKTEEFKQALSQNPQLKQMFDGIDIDTLAQKLKNG